MPVDLDVRREGGIVWLKSRVPLPPHEANLAAALMARAETQGEAAALRFRDGDGWTSVSYATFAGLVCAATQYLIANKMAGRPLIVMAGNTLPAAVWVFACYASGAIHTPVGLAYGLAGGDFARLKHVIAKTGAAMIYADPHPALQAAVAACRTPDMLVADFGEAVTCEPTAMVDLSIEARDVEAVASYMLTSGSTGLPKVVPQTLAMIAAGGAQAIASIGQAANWGGTMLDWLPWHHAAGASVLRCTLLEGGTLHVDDGKPMPGLFDTTIRNLREVSVAYFNNVPSGYAMLVDALDVDPVLRKSFFKDMRLMLYGGAGLPQAVYDRLQAHAIAETGHRIHMTTGYGMTETVTGCMVIHFPTTKVGIGLPAPGLEVKLVPHDARYEVRLRGPNVMKGYLDDPVKNAAVFDDEGYYRTGDLAVFHDDADPGQGLAFAGRLAEEFKLASGAWVYGGQLREQLLGALDGLVSDLVLADDNRPYLAVLAWPKGGATMEMVLERVRGFNAAAHGGSSRIARVLLLERPPSVDAHEVSDKGSINRRAVLDGRVAEVERLFAEPVGVGVGVA
ncbi:feruloyl-CoA synthase [Polymorphobacter multimanifer]|uniref:Feruloyl-CoA synthase n=1 Tax=Polymorphobacter multimanifer TaxID=1070431 RepID=A0A841LA93_9SPHN|nr:AMP-binding protein [Polymorphobacter multimanifer]MBB6227883.1 feruloyl-CoA synthase [Polymorphobacter multimanifer]